MDIAEQRDRAIAAQSHAELSLQATECAHIRADDALLRVSAHVAVGAIFDSVRSVTGEHEDAHRAVISDDQTKLSKYCADFFVEQACECDIVSDIAVARANKMCKEVDDAATSIMVAECD
eukprot:Opistho-2@50401